jgi:hypothetical protein
MTEDEERQAACAGKKRFGSAALALRIANRRRGYGRTTRRREAYHCGFCGFWHVGNSANTRRRSR